MTIEELKQYKKVLILGYGVTGKATEEFFKKFLPQIELVIADEKDDPNYLSKQDDVDLVIKSPGVKKNKVYKPYTSLIDIYLENTPLTTIGITGTKGKSTTISLLKNILDKAGKRSFILGNIGSWDLDALLPDQQGFALFELSSYQLEDIGRSPHIAVFLNIYKEHHTHASYSDYFEAKKRIITYQTRKDYFVYNSSIEEIKSIANDTKAHVVAIDMNKKILHKNPHLQGSHNRLNIQTVATICQLIGIETRFVQEGIDTYLGLPHRLEYVGKYCDINFYNDSASNNPAATVGAIDALDSVDTLIVGGQDRDFDFSEVVGAIIDANVKTLILFPETGEKILKLLEKENAVPSRTFKTNSMGEAVEIAYKYTPQDGLCLLSPGAPSYLQYKNFPARGDDFVKNIKLYCAKKKID